ncbi:MAG: Divergent InlB B-repeat domain, partial [Thermoleophilaceae bacterium]|nr:Divergent InlB B-repeat domain [Thermoleophilaceae bacterium]
ATKQTVNLLTINHKIVNIGMLGTLWGTKKAHPGKTSFDQLAKLYPGIKIGYTCALDFGHVAILKKGKFVTVFATSNNTPPTAAFGQINIVDFSKTGYAQVEKGQGLNTRSECDPKNRQQPSINGGDPNGGGTTSPGGTTPVKPQYTVAGDFSGDGDGEVTASSTASDANCRSSSCTVYSGSPVTLTAKALSGSHFTGWSGDCSGTDPVFSFESVDADKSCKALFALDNP